MENKGVLLGAIIFVFASFILMIVMLVYESYKAKQVTERMMARANSAKPRVMQPVKVRDFSMYKLMVGNDGREMVEIPEGPFTMGNDEGDPDERPAHPVYQSTFFIDLKEVTQSEYERFANMTKRGRPMVPVFEEDLSLLAHPDYPVVGVTWNDAVAYCRWAGKRLPTESEWEKAARGEGKRLFPWGNEFYDSYANIDGEEDGYKYLGVVGSFEAGRSPYGLFDATGNVAEWVADSYEADYYQKSPYRDPMGPPTTEFKVIRGASWRETKFNARVTKRFSAKMWRTDATVGFRCAKSPDATPSQS